MQSDCPQAAVGWQSVKRRSLADEVTDHQIAAHIEGACSRLLAAYDNPDHSSQERPGAPAQGFYPLAAPGDAPAGGG